MSHCYQKWGPAAHHSTACKEATMVERKVCFISESGNGEGRADSCPNADSFPTTDNQWATALVGGGRGLHVETAQSALTVILKLGLGGLTSLILTV